MRAVFRKFGVLAHLTRGDRMRVLAALILMALVRLALWTLPFRWVSRVIAGCGSAHPLHQRLTHPQVARMVHLASRNIPNATCLTQALTAQMLLNFAGLDSRLHIGVRRDRRFEAHAWVECAGRVLVGSLDDIGGFTPMLTLGKVS